ncbi:MAG: saccharopine dehydrogenase NADP-binding domain-containing protein [Desulfobacter sp.]|nr:MAG: saccharopine dehydrogenase NADP-binding domain-containing protein [Desulfobacter sp.]
MKNILILGAGLVSRPGIIFLLENKFKVTVASRTLEKAQKMVQGFENGTAAQILVDDTRALDALVKQHDIIVSLLPWTHHILVARSCLANNKHMVTTSYVSQEMKNLSDQAKAKNLLFLNEIGVDPGIDHMSAMKIIDEVHAENGKIRHFYSFCGGLPAPEDNDNPLGYKFSWSPKGVVLASKNPARFLENKEHINIKGEDLFLNYRRETIKELGEFEVYPNRDSMPYKEIYGLKDAHTVMRGTYRNIGWCDTFKKIVDLGLVDDTPVSHLSNISFKKMMATLPGIPENKNIKTTIAQKAGIAEDHFVIQNLEWLGLFSNDPIPALDNYLDILSEKLWEKLVYKPGEKDMLVLRHTFVVENQDGSEKTITSTLINYGIPFGDSSMARTVSLPLGIGIKLIAQGKIDLTGVQIPIKKEIYTPVLKALEDLGIQMVEKTKPKP